jgi:hypothetical protein
MVVGTVFTKLHFRHNLRKHSSLLGPFISYEKKLRIVNMHPVELGYRSSVVTVHDKILFGNNSKQIGSARKGKTMFVKLVKRAEFIKML